MTPPKAAKRSKKGRAAITDHAKMDYPDIRDLFLAGMNSEKHEVEWLVKVGAFVQHCWLAEEHERSCHPDKVLTEQDLWHVWDRCTKGQFEMMSAKALDDLAQYRRKRNVQDFMMGLAERFAPLRLVAQGVAWFFMQAWKGFVGGFGLILLSLLLLLLQPNIVKKVRSALDGLLPAATQPAALPSARDCESGGGKDC